MDPSPFPSNRVIQSPIDLISVARTYLLAIQSHSHLSLFQMVVLSRTCQIRRKRRRAANMTRLSPSLHQNQLHSVNHKVEAPCKSKNDLSNSCKIKILACMPLPKKPSYSSAMGCWRVSISSQLVEPSTRQHSASSGSSAAS